MVQAMPAPQLSELPSGHSQIIEYDGLWLCRIRDEDDTFATLWNSEEEAWDYLHWCKDPEKNSIGIDHRAPYFALCTIVNTAVFDGQSYTKAQYTLEDAIRILGNFAKQEIKPIDDNT